MPNFNATKTADQTFEIVDGIRRSKAADLVGNKTIKTDVLDANDKKTPI
ncbi:ParB/RepB/Spo0J family partition protein [Gynuella sunshinyii]